MMTLIKNWDNKFKLAVYTLVSKVVLNKMLKTLLQIWIRQNMFLMIGQFLLKNIFLIKLVYFNIINIFYKNQLHMINVIEEVI